MMLLFMFLGGTFNLWSFNIEQLDDLDNAFWAWTFVSWNFSLMIGSYASAMISRAAEAEDGILHGMVTWASSSFLLAAFLYMYSGNFLSQDLTQAFMVGAFITQLVALVLSLYAGYLGTIAESSFKLDQSFEKENLQLKEHDSVVGS